MQTGARPAGHLDWPGLAQVCRLERTARCKGRTTVEIQCVIRLSLPTGCQEIVVALCDFCYRPRKLLQFLGIMKNRSALLLRHSLSGNRF